MILPPSPTPEALCSHKKHPYSSRADAGDFTGGPGAKKPPANEGDTGSTPGLRRSHGLRSSHNYQSPCSATREANATRSPRATTREQPLPAASRERPHGHQRRPRAAKNKCSRKARAGAGRTGPWDWIPNADAVVRAPSAVTRATWMRTGPGGRGGGKGAAPRAPSEPWVPAAGGGCRTPPVPRVQPGGGCRLARKWGQ